MKRTLFLATLPVAALGAGCFSRPAPVTMAPPVAAPPPPAAVATNSQVWDWHDVPKNEKIPITRGVFDQGGYQLYARTGETVVVPFENQNMYVMKFGQTSGDNYFIVEDNVPTLYMRSGQYLENAAAQGAKWYPFSQNYAYERPAYIGIAPSWSDYMAMGWYSGMIYHGGYWGYSPWHAGYMGYRPMVGLNINIGGRGYDWGGYRNYYQTNTLNRYNMRSASSYNYNSVGRRAPSSFGTRSTGGFSSSRPGSGSFGRSSTGTFGRSSGTRYSPSSPGSSGSFGRSSGSSSTFGRSSGSFGSSSSPGFGSSSRRSSGSFGSGASGYSRSTGSFGRSSSSSGSFGRSSSSFGRSSGGFGRRR
ncbi:MAG: hypothetical protein QM758_09915 [Armatimonas sp.]